MWTNEGRAVPSAAEAVEATLVCARRLGLPFDDPQVVAEGYSVRVRLCPAPVISRVVTAGEILRGDPRPWLQREIDVVRHLHARGAPVVPAWDEPGPFVANGLHVSLWTWVEQLSGAVSSAEFGTLIRDLHKALDTFDRPLPPLVGPLTDVRSALTRSDAPVLHAAAAALIPLALSWPRRPLHGDAHTGNVLLTAGGPRWIDFEDACSGPLEWDLASRSLSDDAAAAYGNAVDRGRLEDCRDLRRLQILAGVLTDDVQDASLYDELVGHLQRWC